MSTVSTRANTDILLGKNCGLQTLLVGSGVHRFNYVCFVVCSFVCCLVCYFVCLFVILFVCLLFRLFVWPEMSFLIPFCSLEETRTWEASEKEEERKLVADFYLDKLGDLLDRVKDL